MNQEKAQERIKELKGYYAHLDTFILVNLFLIMINVMTNSDDGGDYWFVYPLFGWGIGLSIHTFTTFFCEARLGRTKNAGVDRMEYDPGRTRTFIAADRKPCHHYFQR